MVLLLVIAACKKPDSLDSTPPTVIITSPIDSSVVSEITLIEVTAIDNVGVDHVQFWVDGANSGVGDDEEPYSFSWNTVGYDRGSAHSIVVKAYDFNENVGVSDTLTLIVDNSLALPLRVALNLVRFEAQRFAISWSTNRDLDFARYSLIEASRVDMADGSEVFSTSSRNDTSYLSEIIPENVRRYYRVTVEDTLGLKSMSNRQTGSSYRKVAYTSWVIRDFTTTPEIMLVDIDGENVRQVTDFPREMIYSVEFSPDGELLAYVILKNDGTSNRYLYLTDLYGSYHRLLSRAIQSHWTPKFSPDGSRIVFANDEEGGNDIYSINIDGSDKTKMTENGGSTQPSYSPDGQKILFTAFRQINLMNADGSSMIKITNGSKGPYYSSFSQSGDKIIYAQNDHIKITEMDFNSLNLTEGFGSARYPTVSSRNQIIFWGDSLGNRGIFIMDLDGSNKINLTPGFATGQWPRVSKDGNKIVFQGDVSGVPAQIIITNSDGSELFNLSTNETINDKPVIQPRN